MDEEVERWDKKEAEKRKEKKAFRKKLKEERDE